MCRLSMEPAPVAVATVTVLRGIARSCFGRRRNLKLARSGLHSLSIRAQL